MKNGKWTHIFHFPFTMKKEKRKNGHPILFSIFHRKWKIENG